MNHKVLIIGAGGREHAIARAFANSPKVERVFVAPGNPGMERDEVLDQAPIECVDLEVTAIAALVEFAETNNISVTFVGPEQPLELGIVDEFRQRNLAIVGPTKVGAQLENSKWFAKNIMGEAQVKTAQCQFFEFEQFEAALTYCHTIGLPFVMKVDGLMAGKGVIIPETMAEAETALIEIMQTMQKNLLIEEFMVGVEFSHFSLVNEDHIISLGNACDYKRVGDNDQGLNTGGMGAFAPVPWVNDQLNQQIIDEIVRPVAKQMVANGTPFTGILYTGVILTSDGPKVVEFNTRLGDPETQILLPLLATDFYDVIEAHLSKTTIQIAYEQQSSLGIVLAAEGYPGPCQTNIALDNTDMLQANVLYAGVGGTKESLYSTGGRILMMTAQAATLTDARNKAYQLMNQLAIPQTFYRKDIGLNRDK